MKNFLTILFLIASTQLTAQKIENTLDLGLAAGSSQGSFTGAYIHNWRFGKRQKIEIGVGGRFTAYLGANQYYVTAPAKLTSGSTGPGVIFVDNITANIDTFLVASPQIFSFNALINLGYRFTEKFSVSFNIDAVGFSLGGQRNGNYINGFKGQITSASPTTLNALLVSDNDLGTLNSEFVGKYKLNSRWSIKAGAQFLFTEYTTTTKVQQLPEPNDRFRNKSLMFTAGVILKLK